MKEILLTFPQTRIHDCRIIIGGHTMDHIGTLIDLSKFSNVFVLTDKTVQTLFLRGFLSALPKGSTFLSLPPGEKEKSMRSLKTILTTMHGAHCDRTSLLINLGGGVISDMGGFAASVFMRGINYINIPTTLLSMADAAIGGKTGVNFAGVKNLIGTFHQPIAVIVDTAVLDSLPAQELTSGMAEVVKHGLIADRKLFLAATAKKPNEFTNNELAELIALSLAVKSRIVMGDEKEHSQRKILNFGHTVGHAIEALSQDDNQPLLHGQAILLGMIIESHISHLKGLLAPTHLQTINRTLVPLALVKRIHGFTRNSIVSKIESDKKSKNGTVQWTLLRGIGRAVVNQKVRDSMIHNALAHMKGVMI